MPRTPRLFRLPLVALAAIFAASFAASDASACSTMKQDQGACRTACGCCANGGDEAPTNRAAAVPAVVPWGPRVGCSAPAETCSCRSQEPAAPLPKPARSTAESRPETGEASFFVRFGEYFAARTALAPRIPATQSPHKAPLYLQNAHLLF